MAGRGRLYMIGAGAALLLFIAGGAFVASRASEPDETASAATASAEAASPVAAGEADAASNSAASNGAASNGVASNGAASSGAAPTAVSPATVLVETVNPDPPVTVQVLSATRVTPDTVRVELALVNKSASPEALDLGGLTAAAGAGASKGTAGKPSLSLTDLCLLTTNGSRRLFALRDDQNKPVGSGDFAPLGPNERRVIWAVFPAPPAADTHATLLVGAVTLRNVPISPIS